MTLEYTFKIFITIEVDTQFNTQLLTSNFLTKSFQEQRVTFILKFSDLLKKSAPSRVIFVSSILAFTNNLTVQNLNRTPTLISGVLSDIVLYGNSKLMNIITANIFGEKLQSSGITTYSVHPGIVNTAIYRNFKGENALPLFKFFIYKFLLPLAGKVSSSLRLEELL